MKTATKHRGFTLVELLVVMSIISILATIILGGFRASQRRAKDTKRKSDLQQVGKALEMFYNDHERYPDSYNGQIRGCSYEETNPSTSNPCDWGSGEFSDGNTIYFRELPDDLTSSNYYYRSVDAGKGYQIYARLENPEDAGCIPNGCNDPQLPGTDRPVCGSDDCNFAVTSTNVTPSQEE